MPLWCGFHTCKPQLKARSRFPVKTQRLFRPDGHSSLACVFASTSSAASVAYARGSYKESRALQSAEQYVTKRPVFTATYSVSPWITRPLAELASLSGNCTAFTNFPAGWSKWQIHRTRRRNDICLNEKCIRLFVSIGGKLTLRSEGLGRIWIWRRRSPGCLRCFTYGVEYTALHMAEYVNGRIFSRKINYEGTEVIAPRRSNISRAFLVEYVISFD